MLLGGLQKSSLIDYPGRLSCVIFLSGCNFDCPYCHNPSLATGKAECRDLLNQDNLYNFLDKRRGFLDGVVISGGEPTIQKNLYKLCEAIKELGYSIKLDTNGSRPEELKRLIANGLVDYIAMDIKTEPVKYKDLICGDFNPDDLLSSIVTIMQSAPDYEFRTTCARGFVDECIIENISKLIKGANLYALQSFNHAEILHPEFFKDQKRGLDPVEIDKLKFVAEPWVKECVIR
jgi:pyruvate formate lyase activating enzyme